MSCRKSPELFYFIPENFKKKKKKKKNFIGLLFHAGVKGGKRVSLFIFWTRIRKYILTCVCVCLGRETGGADSSRR